MWLFVVFDLPMESSAEKKAYRLFRKQLCCLGFSLVQRSVYRRWADHKMHAERIIKKLKNTFPARGDVMIFKLPHAVFQHCESFDGVLQLPLPQPPSPWQII